MALFGNIAIDIDKVLANLKKFEPHGVPPENALLETEGSPYGAASTFNNEIRATAMLLEDVALRVRTNLENTREQVVATMNDMIAMDDSVAADAQLVTQRFNDVNAAPVPVPESPTKPAPVAIPKHVNPGLK